MKSIKPLPEAVRSTVRSGVILFDLTRVVEELIFNSLDAGASKVSIFVGVGTNYVKVVDDGSGISRDGLVSLGERYVTSKLYRPVNLDAAGGSFGFKGEALASISDVSLLEIVTKAHGKPNGYRKVIKGSKCLYLGIDDDRKEVGTTVVVRDLFYNQPVRRKHMQSSPRKALHSVKKCVLCIALVQPNVSFSVVDIESEDELLCTNPSSSPLPLLKSNFGIEDFSSLQKVNSVDGVLKLSGYISDPRDSFAVKVFQYVYINSRIVCNGPIHKLLNNLATSFECLDPSKANNGSKKGKRIRSQAYPAYILNIICHPSLYDLTFEPSKTHVEFKDWKPILTFIEKAIQHLWGNSLNSDRFRKEATCKEDDSLPVTKDLLGEGFSVGSKFTIKKCRTQNNQPTSDLPRPYDKIQLEEFHKNAEQFREQMAGYSFQSCDSSLAKCPDSVSQKSDDHISTPHYNFLSTDVYLGNRIDASERSNRHAKSNSLSSKLDYDSFKFENDVTNELAGFYHELSNESLFRKDIRKPFLQSCSSRESPPFDGTFFERENGIESPINSFTTKRKLVCPSEGFNILEVNVTDQRFDYLSRNMWHDSASYAKMDIVHEDNDKIPSDFNILTRTSVKPFLLYGDTSSEEYGFLSDSDIQVENTGSRFQSLRSEWCSVTSDPFEHFPTKAFEGSLRSGERDYCWHSFDIEEKKFQFTNDLMSRSSSKGNCTFSSKNTGLEFKEYADSGRDCCRSFQEYNLGDKFSLGYSDVPVEEEDWFCSDLHGKDYNKDWFCSDLCGKDYKSINEYESQRDQFGHQDSERNPVPRGRSRSNSAPPFHRHKSRFISLNNGLPIAAEAAEAAEQPTFVEGHDGFTSLETGELKHSQQSSDLGLKQSFAEDRENVTDELDTMLNIKRVQKSENFEQPQCLEDLEDVPGKEFFSEQNQDHVDSGTKWRNGCAWITPNNESCDVQNQDNILDISSGFLHLATDSLVPESINKNCLENAKVLQQVDKKFIPIVAGGTLAVIDQHAADERIRLEELRQKVLSGEAKTVTYLDTEQELIMPEIGYQLLHNYAEQIKYWGWICNIHAEDSRSFKRTLNLLHQQPAVVTLIAVPCILGVNLSDVDLLEFLQQLADTDGSSTMPPSILRVLNFKACRGAIMFGDSLLPSECSLIIQELKQTSLCFQCAHGRPTTVPLLNLEELHKQMAKLEALDGHSRGSWHGLRRHGFSIERASQRLCNN
ncbi:hypothetical protein SLEP1_g39048 [Rubroshorea leprosula]|uniref:DNA mismatch repair protein MLH3 n=1 Tax=Rubroshorea leprosula TaxID=152421 RepID=A0AAV5L030_9ROSI|nr:hypothetical protein SLEP1_g39048 [Rubroshorea leprosula]